MELKMISIEKPESINFILGQSHFIKTVEDVHEALVNTVPGIKFGLVFCESSGKCLIRWSGTDDAMIELAKKNARLIGAGHSFILFLAEGYYPDRVAFIDLSARPATSRTVELPWEIGKESKRYEIVATDADGLVARYVTEL